MEGYAWFFRNFPFVWQLKKKIGAKHSYSLLDSDDDIIYLLFYACEASKKKSSTYC